MLRFFSILHSGLSSNFLIVSFTRVITSFLGAFLFNIPWLVLFISFGKSPEGITRTVLWCSAPLIIASGYSYGIIVYDRVVMGNRDSFFLVLPWALLGCIAGELITLSSGPMVIGLSIFISGGIAVALREMRIVYQKKRGA